MIGRKKEVQELNDLYDRKKAEFVAVYGRRRVGKTYLVEETFKGKSHSDMMSFSPFSILARYSFTLPILYSAVYFFPIILRLPRFSGPAGGDPPESGCLRVYIGD